VCRSGLGEGGGGEHIEETINSGTQYGMSNDLGTAPLVFEPQIDFQSAIGVVAIAGVVVLLQVRARAVESARERRAEVVKQLQELRVKKLSGYLDEDALPRLEAQIAELEEQEEAAKTLFTIFGTAVRIITPQPLGTPVESLDSKDPRNATELFPNRRSAESESRSVVLSILTVLSTLALLAIVVQMAIDPMNSASETYVIPTEVGSPFR